MQGQATAVRRRRLRTAGSLACAVGLHLAVLLLFLSWKVPVMVTAPAAQPISLYILPGPGKEAASQAGKPIPTAVAPPAAPSAPSAKTAPEAAAADDSLKLKPSVDPPADVATIPTAALAAAPPPPAPLQLPSAAIQALAASQAGGKACHILDVLGAMLRNSEAVREALPRIPARSRSVANAVMLWDGRWTDAPTLGGPVVLNVIQSTVSFGVSAAPASCQAELVRGPRLITVGDARDTVVLGFGSGEWRWGDLLAGLPTPQSAADATP